MADDHLVTITHNPSPTTPLPSIPLHLSGFLSGETIQVEGDTDNLQFSVQFNIKHKHNTENQFHFPIPISPENQTSLSPNSSSHMTPITTHEKEDQIENRGPLCDAIDWTPTGEESCSMKKETIVTRLKSGVLSPVKYYPRNSKNILPWRKREMRKIDRRKRDVLERVLRRHSCPIRPCSSYTFFVMETWGVLKSSSFGETSKRLGEMWCRLPHSEKKVFEDMALKDNARYKRQCMLMSGQSRG